ncbi:MAG TPA: hypothetical protein VJ990_05450 [Clostridia bacterium]|nr:hypothetical protein [Clostridia bacterium]
MTSKDFAILVAPMLISLIISLGYGKNMAGKKIEFPKILTKAMSIHGRIMILSAIGWALYATGWRQKIIGVIYMGIAFLVVGMIDYVAINKMTAKD